MKREKLYILVCLAAILIAACSRTDDADKLPGEVTPPTVTPPAVTPPTETSVPVQIKVSPESVERLQLFVFPENGDKRLSHTLERTEKGWNLDLQWNEIGTGATFTAFSADGLEKTEDETFLHSIQTNQQEDASGAKSDLLFASATVKSGNTVELQLASLMSRLIVSLHSGDGSYSEAELASAKVSVRSHTSVSVSVSDGKLGNLSEQVEEVIPYRKENGDYTAVLCPQSVDGFRESWISVTIGEDTQIFGAPEMIGEEVFSALKSAVETTINIDICKPKTPEPEPEHKPDVKWANRTVWVYGVKEPAESDWGYVSGTNQKGLTWKKGCGWYDCNKINMAGDPDGSMCWAATASNMIYWWLDQNADNIRRYGKYNGPTAYDSSTSCAVFDYFKRYFVNKRDNTLFGLNWFFVGRSSKPNGGNFFSDVFSDVADVVSGVDADEFNSRMKQAFTDKEAIGFYVKMMGSYHEMSIWGADFDENGRISAVYITDSNDLSQEEITPSVSSDGRRFIPVGLVRHPVAYKVSEADNGKTMVYMEGSVEGSFTLKFEALHFLGLMEDEWKEYFSTHGN